MEELQRSKGRIRKLVNELRLMSAIILSLFLFSGISMGMTLSVNGKTDYIIVVSKDSSLSEKRAASELQIHLNQVTGAIFPIKTAEYANLSSKKIVVGLNSLFKTKFPEIKYESLQQDGIVLKTLNDDLYLAGGGPRGTLYAVYTFLEDYVGCKWWTSTESYIPSIPTLGIANPDKIYIPSIQYREALYSDLSNNGVFAARQKNNGHYNKISEDYGGHYEILGFVHTFDRLLPAEIYFPNHPEWYSLIDGKRRGGQNSGQLCLTNEEMKAELLRKALEWIRKNPEAGFISISQNDNINRCQCEKCQELERLEGSPSGPLIHFVNAIAEEIEREYPEFLVETLAYQYSRKPPLHIKPRDNVIIRLCSIECSFAEPLTSAQNEEFCKDLKGWSKISKHLFVWDYTANFSNFMFPHPNLRVLKPNIRLFNKFNTIGLLEQGDSRCTVGEFVELKAWVISHLMWDPSLNAEGLIDEFLNGYYGPAAVPLKQYLNLIHDAVERENTYLKTFMPTTTDWFKLADMNQAVRFFDKAEEIVKGNSVLEERVRKARLSLDLVWLIDGNYYFWKEAAEKAGTEFLGPPDPSSTCRSFIETAKKYNPSYYTNFVNFSVLESALDSLYLSQVTPPKECSNLERYQWMDIQESSMTLYELGRRAEIVMDSAASNGQAVRMAGDHNAWLVQFVFNLPIESKVRIFVVARIDSENTSGKAFTTGVYDTAEKVEKTFTIKIEDVAGYEYKTFDLGVYDPQNKYVYVAPIGDSRINYVYVDRIFFIREN